MPEAQQLLPRFRAAHTQVLGVSIDSVYCHANWAKDLGGVSFPLLSDFQPKGEVGRKFGVYLEEAGIEDRATVFLDSSGIVRHSSSVTPKGKRDVAALAKLCESLDAESTSKLEKLTEPAGLPKGTRLFVKSRCGFSRAALVARDNLHLKDQLEVHNVTQEAGARTDLLHLTGRDQAPCLVADGKPIHESADIIRYLVNATTDLPG